MRIFLWFILAVLLSATASAQSPGARPDSSAFFAVRDHESDLALSPGPTALREQVRDPFFGFVFTMAAEDSLGSWTPAQLQEFAAAWGEESVFPVAEHLVSLRREAVPDDQLLGREGVRCRRRWVIELRPELLEIPMPYSILGYHPGSLSFRTPLVLHEWPVGARSIDVTVEGATRRYHARGVTVFQIVSGWIILDVDAWIDKLLGGAADDAVMEGFTLGWVDGKLVGVGASAGRKGRRLFGELNFTEGKIESHGRPVARGLNSEGRRWLSRRELNPREVWRRYDG